MVSLKVYKNNAMKKTLTLSIILLNTLIINGQDKNAIDATRTEIEVTFLGEKYMEWEQDEFLPSISDLSHMNKSSDETANKAYKEGRAEAKLANAKPFGGLASSSSLGKTESANLNVVGGFSALSTQGTPSDNSIAINTQGVMIAAVNSNLRYYSSNGTASTGSINLSTFFANPNNGNLNSNNICDPVVTFDPEANRFIVMAITCDFSASAQSQILLAFSKTENPLQGWNVYQFTGSPGVFTQNMLFDYPKVGVSNHDVFISGNFFRLSNGSYAESGVYQIDKTIGFSGGSYTSASGGAIVFTGISGNPFTLVPATNGQSGGYGDHMYLVASRSGLSSPTSQIKFYEINTYVQNNPTITLTDLFLNESYEGPVDAIQNGSNVTLSTGDTRGMDAIYVDGTIHFVFHCLGPDDYNAIKYVRIIKNGSNWSVNDMLINASQVELAYPSIASMGWTPSDQAVAILMDYSSADDYPGVAAVFVSHEMEASNILAVKQGTNPVTQFNQGGSTRWGDYSGLSRLQGASTPTAFGYGMYGSTGNFWNNYVVQLQSQQGPVSNKAVGISQPEIVSYPNPVFDVWTSKLNITEGGRLDVVIYSVDGRKVKDLYTADLRSGEHEFRFNKGALSPGNYIISFTLDEEQIASEKIQVVE